MGWLKQIGSAATSAFKTFAPKAVDLGKQVIGAARYASNAVDKGREMYSKLGDTEKQLLNRGLETVLNKAGPERTRLLTRGLQTGNNLLEAVKKDGDQMVQKLSEVERVAGLSPAEQMRVLGEKARQVDFGRLKEDLKGPIDRLKSVMQ